MECGDRGLGTVIFFKTQKASYAIGASHALTTVYSKPLKFITHCRAKNWHWEGTVQLHKAITASAIISTTWNKADCIRVYLKTWILLSAIIVVYAALFLDAPRFCIDL